MKLSRCARHLAFTLEAGDGEEAFQAFTRDVTTGTLRHVDALGGVVSLEWAADGRTLLATQPNDLGRPWRVLACDAGGAAAGEGGGSSRGSWATSGRWLAGSGNAVAPGGRPACRPVFEEGDERFFVELGRTKDWRQAGGGRRWLLGLKGRRGTGHSAAGVPVRGLYKAWWQGAHACVAALICFVTRNLQLRRPKFPATRVSSGSSLSNCCLPSLAPPFPHSHPRPHHHSPPPPAIHPPPSPLLCRFLTINCNSKSSSEVHLLPADPSHSVQRIISSAGGGSSCWPAPQVVQSRLPGLEYFVEHNRGQLYILSNARGADNYAVYR